MVVLSVWWRFAWLSIEAGLYLAGILWKWGGKSVCSGMKGGGAPPLCVHSGHSKWTISSSGSQAHYAQ